MEKRKPRGYWTLERCIEDAKQYDSVKEWRANKPNGYNAAKRKGWLKPCREHMTGGNKPHGYWTLERCKESALRFMSKAEWLRGDASAHATATQQGWIDLCCGHMEPALGCTDNDVIYIWRDAETDLHKVGVTSARTGEDRINMCRRSSGMDPRIVFMLKVSDARAVESRLLELGTDPELDSSIDGYTEFRELTNDDLREAVGIAYSAAIAA